MNSCVVYFYKSNKNYFKEDYESAYICSYLKKFGNSDVFLYSPATPLALNTKYDLYFIKIYEKEQLSDLYLFIKQNSISVLQYFSMVNIAEITMNFFWDIFLLVEG